jgi:anti-sigma regulatory factor (Ser/Thr protein kinase)
MLVLYTDGLVEKRDIVLDERLDLLRASAEACVEESVAVVPDKLVAMLDSGGSFDDDICVLVMRARHSASIFVYDFPAAPSELRACRAALRTWLRAIGVSTNDEQHVLLAAGEAIANAVEHAYRDGEAGSVTVTASLNGETCVCLSIRDGGRWSDHPSMADRGFGRSIIADIADDFAFDITDTGTEVRLRRRLSPMSDFARPAAL